MKASIKASDLIEHFEAFKAKAYKCPAGVWTIGFGTTKNVKQGMEVSITEARALLSNTILEIENDLNKLNLKLNQNQFDALVSFIYNLGLGNFKKSTLLKLIEKNPNNSLIRQEFMKWKLANGKVLNGLVRRREAEANLYFE